MRSKKGFTLIEILVAVAIMSVALAVLTVSFRGLESRLLKQEGERLAFLMEAARQESILENRALALELKKNSYEFLTPNLKGEWVPLKNDDIFRPRNLPAGIKIQNKGQIIFQPTGSTPSVQISLRKGDNVWSVQQLKNGLITVASPL